MNKQERERIHNLSIRLAIAGFSLDEIETMRRCSRTLSRWCEMECNGEIERDDDTNKPRLYWEMPNGTRRRGANNIADREAGAQRRMDSIMAAHPEWAWYYQADPRGCAVYIYRKDHDFLKEYPIDSIYSSIGIGIY